MIDETTYFDGFERVEVMKYDGINGDGLARFLGRGHGDWTHYPTNGGTFVCGDVTVRLDQWAVRKADGTIEVRAEEPVRVESWNYAKNYYGSRGLTDERHAEERQPVLSNGWVGPWEPMP